MNNKHTKHAFGMSILALVLCLAMLVGTTFAWFTDSASSGANTIASGNLDVELYHSNSTVTDEKVTETTENLFEVALWEPGVVTYENFTIKNEGSLALTYQLNLNISRFNDLNGKDLSEVIKVVMIDGDHFTGDRADAQKLFDGSNELVTEFDSVEDVTISGNLTKENLSKEFAVVLYWEPTANDNLYNVSNNMQTSDGKPLFLNVALSLFATQFPYESDSFGNDYDENVITEVNTVDELDDALSEGGIIMLGSADFTNVNINATKDATILVSQSAIGGTINVAKDVSLTLQDGKAAPITVSGEGTLVLSGINIDAASEAAGVSALTLAESSAVKVVISGANTLAGAKNGSGIYVPAATTLDLSGTGSLTAVGNAGLEYLEGYTEYSNTTDASFAQAGGHGIGGEGTINIHDFGTLTAEGYGKHGYGIGGNVADITIKNGEIAYARGGFAQAEAIIETKYAKDEPEGGAAIGSNYSEGAVITLENVTIVKAEGGSKAAGIGAAYWTPVTINITGCTIDEVIGGVSSAGIGGARIRETDATYQTTTINITDSTIKTQGGYYGAGIGSGYDTHCHTPEVAPLCTINISGSSKINATGGKYAAGIGTGYHAGRLAGNITGDITATPGDDFYKDSYTKAMGIGFGILDPTRDGLNNTSSITYNGTVITIPEPAGSQN